MPPADNKEESKQTNPEGKAPVRRAPSRTLSSESTEEFIHPLTGPMRVKKDKGKAPTKVKRTLSKEKLYAPDYHSVYYKDSDDEDEYTKARKPRRSTRIASVKRTPSQMQRDMEQHMQYY